MTAALRLPPGFTNGDPATWPETAPRLTTLTCVGCSTLFHVPADDTPEHHRHRCASCRVFDYEIVDAVERWFGEAATGTCSDRRDGVWCVQFRVHGYTVEIHGRRLLGIARELRRLATWDVGDWHDALDGDGWLVIEVTP